MRTMPRYTSRPKRNFRSTVTIEVATSIFSAKFNLTFRHKVSNVNSAMSMNIERFTA